MNDQVEQIVLTYTNRFNIERISFAPNIPKRKAKRALRVCNISRDPDDLLLLFDKTLTRNGKRGFMITHTGICMRELFEKPIFISYDDIHHLQVLQHPVFPLLQVNQMCFCLDADDMDITRLFADMIRRIVQTLHPERARVISSLAQVKRDTTDLDDVHEPQEGSVEPGQGHMTLDGIAQFVCSHCKQSLTWGVEQCSNCHQPVIRGLRPILDIPLGVLVRFVIIAIAFAIIRVLLTSFDIVLPNVIVGGLAVVVTYFIFGPSWRFDPRAAKCRIAVPPPDDDEAKDSKELEVGFPETLWRQQIDDPLSVDFLGDVLSDQDKEQAVQLIQHASSRETSRTWWLECPHCAHDLAEHAQQDSVTITCQGCGEGVHLPPVCPHGHGPLTLKNSHMRCQRCGWETEKLYLRESDVPDICGYVPAPLQ